MPSILQTTYKKNIQSYISYKTTSDFSTMRNRLLLYQSLKAFEPAGEFEIFDWNCVSEYDLGY